MDFRGYRRRAPERWVVLLEGRLYGEYLDKEQALLDAVEAATEARSAGHEAEVWDELIAVRVY